MYIQISDRLGQAPEPSAVLPLQPPRVLTYSARDVIDHRISVPAQHSLVRLSKNPATNADAVGMLEEIKASRLAGIYCVNWEKSAERALKFGKSWWTVIPSGEDAILMLDPANPGGGQPLIAFRRELDPRDKGGCGKLKTDKSLTPFPARLDAAVLKAWRSYRIWQNSRRPNPETGQTIKCTIQPQSGGRVLAGLSYQRLSLAKPLSNVLPPLLCQLLSQLAPPTCSSSHCLVGPCLTHFLDGVKLVPRGDRVRGQFKMCPERMNPGFVDTSTDTVNKNQDLQLALEGLLNSNEYKTLKSKMAVALVDLTGKKLFDPEFAGWRETVQIFGASVPKIAALYAVFQLQHDLHVLANLKQITTGSDLILEARKQWEQRGLKRHLQPKVEELFDFQARTPASLKVVPSAILKDLLCCTFRGGFSCDRTASILIEKIGFQYISSVLWQSGLFHKRRGGLWLQLFYPMLKDCPKKCCENGLPCDDLFKPIKSKDQLTSRPVVIDKKLIHQPGFSPQNVTALSAATYFTLLAQERLASPEASKCISEELSRACSFFGAGQDHTSDRECKVKGFENEDLGLSIVAAKCGFNPPPPQSKQQVTHDCILVEHLVGNKQLRYVVILLTENMKVRGARLVKKDAVCFFRNQFLIDVDKIIQDRNI